MSRRFSLLSATSVLVLASMFVTGCASATSTKEVPLAEPDSRSVGAEGATKSNLTLAPEDPLKKITAEPTGTIVGARVNELLNEVVKLRQGVDARQGQVQEVRGIGAASAIQYHSAIAAIEARLQQGTTPGNPILLRQWDDAQANLDQMSTAVSRMNTLSTDISSDGSTAGYILGSIKAALQLSGAVDEDHDHLKAMQNVVSQNVVQVEQMKTEVSADLLRLNSYMNTERNNLQTLAFAIEKGEYLGNNLSTRPLVLQPTPVATLSGQTVNMPNMYQPVVYASPSVPVQAAPASMQPMQTTSGSTTVQGGYAPAMIGGMPPATEGMMDPNARSGMGMGTAVSEQPGMQMQQPVPTVLTPVSYDSQTQNLNSLPDESGNKMLAVIRFNDPNISYQKQLYTAIAGVIDQQPSALFTVVAVAPESGNAAEVAAGSSDAQRHADDVKRSLIEMGLPPSRIAMSAQGDRDAINSEVHVLVR